MIPTKVSFVLLVIEVSPIVKSTGAVELKSKWHFPGLAFRWLYANQWKSLLEITCKSEITVMLAAQEYGLVSSA